MKLIGVLDEVNQIEKNAFVKILDSISGDLKEKNSEVHQILTSDEGGIKNIENANLVKLFAFCREEFRAYVDTKLQFNDCQLDLLLGILVRDGNSIMSREWFSQLYSMEIQALKDRVEILSSCLNDDDNKTLEPAKKRDYQIYRECVKTALYNDLLENREPRITSDEKSILNTLAIGLGLSAEEAREIFYSVVEIKKLDVDFLIESLKKIGVVFFRSSKHTLYFPDEFVWTLRGLCGNELSTKHFRRILRNLRDSQINRIARQHSIAAKLARNEKIKAILAQGISVRIALQQDIFKDETSKSEKREIIQDLIKRMNLELKRIGSSSNEKVELIIEHFQELEQDDNIGMSVDGYERLLADLQELYPYINSRIREDFELQQEEAMKLELMQSYAIKPMDVVDLLSQDEAANFLEQKNIKKKGDVHFCILESYKDVANLLMENYALIAGRDINGLKEKGIVFKESDLGSKFEELTKKIFETLGFAVNEELRKQFDGSKTQPDAILKLEDNEIAIVECKTIKDSEFKKYSLVSRQLSSYVKACEEKGFKVSHCILVSSGFTDEFIAECEYDYNLHLSLITASGLYKIAEGFKDAAMPHFPKKLFKKSGLIDAERVLQVLNK